MRRYAKCYVLLLGFLFGLFPTATALQAQATETETIKAVVRLIFEQGFNQRNSQIYSTFLAPNHVLHALLPEELIGPAESERYFNRTLDVFPDFAFTVQEVIAEGNVYAVRWTAQGTQLGTFGGIPATGIEVEFLGTTVGRFAGDQVVETWHHRNRLGLLEQIGFLPTGLVPTPEQLFDGEILPLPEAIVETNSDDIRTSIQRLFEEGFNQRNPDVLAEILAPNHRMHQPDRDFVGPGDLHQLMALLWALSSDAQITIDQLVVDGASWAALWTLRGTHLGSLGGVPPTGNPIEMGGTSMGHFINGQAVETWNYPDQVKGLQQIGILPDPVLPRPFLEQDTHIGATSWGQIKQRH